MLDRPIYLDYNATTPVDPMVFEAMEPYLREHYGNPSSATHAMGWKSAWAVEAARKQVALLLGCPPQDLIFTSGATESNNLAIQGLALARAGERLHFITSSAEHKAVLEVMLTMQERGHDLTIVDVDRYGQVQPESIRRALQPHTALVSIMHANNEVGTINPIGEIGHIVREHGKALLHTDATQTAGKIALDMDALKIDMLSLSAHKMCGPKGVGALFVRGLLHRPLIKPLVLGGSQERGFRPGTQNVPGIVGLGAACERALSLMSEECPRLQRLRDELESTLLSGPAGGSRLIVNGHPKDRLTNTLSVSFRNLSQDLFATGLTQLAVSSGSACTSANGKSSHVLTAMGVPEELARSTLRISLGRFTTSDEVIEAAQILSRTILESCEI